MQASMFNVRVPLPDRNEVFLMNTFTDAQLLVTSDVADLLDQIEARTSPDALRPLTDEERASIDQLWEHGFLVPDRAQERTALEALLPRRAGEHRPAARDDPDDAAVQLRLRLLHSRRPRRLQQERGADVDGDGGARGRRGWRPASTR